MTPKQKYLPTIVNAVKPILRDNGFHAQGHKFTLTLSDDVQVQFWLMIVRQINDGCLELRPGVSIYSNDFARLGRLYEGPPDWAYASIEIQLTRLENRRDLRQWQICSEADAKLAAEVIVNQVSEHLLPFIPQVDTAEKICRALEQDYQLNFARPHIVEKWCQQYRASQLTPQA